MQDILNKIFEIAIKELPDRHQKFINEEAVLYRGFKISKSLKGYYSWEDTRYSNYYEPVDPNITTKVIENGFSKTLNEVMLHNDQDKVLNLSREIEKKDALISYWVKESTKIYNEFEKKNRIFNLNKKLTDEIRKKRLDSLRKRYDKKKSLYQKKRRVITQEREQLKADKKFFESRIKLYNN